MSQPDAPTAQLDGHSSSDDAQDKAQQAAGQAQEKAQEAADQAKSQLRDQIDQRSTQAGEQLAGHAGDIRTVSEELRKQGSEQPAKLAEQAADRAERLSGYLKDSDSDRIVRDVEDLGRRQPWAVVAGGLVLGFAASRFLKASSSERQRSATASSNGGLPAGNGAPAPRAVAPQSQPGPLPPGPGMAPTLSDPDPGRAF